MKAKVIEKKTVGFIVSTVSSTLVTTFLGGVYLTVMLKDLAFSDNAIGIILSLSALASVSSVFIRLIKKGSNKFLSLLFSVARYGCDALMFGFYLMDISVSACLIIILYFARGLLNHLADPFYLSWINNLVDIKIRGRFLSLKGVVASIVGIPFSYLVGWYMDKNIDSGTIKTAFFVFMIFTVICGVIETVSLFKTPESSSEVKNESKASEKINFKGIFGQRNFWILMLMYVPWWMAVYSYSPYFSAYQLDTLKLSVEYIAVVGIAGTVTGIIATLVWGWFTDKTSFTNLFLVSAPITTATFLLGAFITEKNGAVMYIVFLVLFNFFSTGVSFGHSGLAFTLMGGSGETVTYGLCQGIGGIMGFLTTLCISGVRTLIEKSGNKFLGLAMHPQQACFVISFILMLVSFIVIVFELKKSKPGFNAK